MPTKISKKLEPVEGVVPKERATCRVPIGKIVHKLIVEGIVKPPANKIAEVSDIIRLITIALDGNAKRECTAVELNELNALFGNDYIITVENLDNPGQPLGQGDKAMFTFPILFAEPFRKSYTGDQMMAWPTLWPKPGGGTQKLFDTFQVFFDIPEVAGASQHAINVYATLEDGLGQLDKDGNPIFNFSQWRRETVTYTSAADRHLTNPIRKWMYQSMHFFTQAGDPISHIKILREGQEIIDVPKRVNDIDLIHYGINPEALSPNRLDVIFDRTDLPEEGLRLNGVREFEVIPRLANAAAQNKVITLITQLYGPIK
ncbi:MAG: hypothetical protein ACK4UN_04120 [Limisphaerales bacterium]